MTVWLQTQARTCYAHGIAMVLGLPPFPPLTMLLGISCLVTLALVGPFRLLDSFGLHIGRDLFDIR